MYRCRSACGGGRWGCGTRTRGRAAVGTTFADFFDFLVEVGIYIYI